MEVEFRPATADDLELMMAWRSHPDLYTHFYEQDGPLYWESHLQWWNSRENRRDWIITVNDQGRWRDVGNINLSNLNGELPEVGVYIGEVTLWGNGIATRAIKFALEWLREHKYGDVRAKILDKNKGSIKAFEKVGFQRVGDARPGESEFRRTL